MFVLNEKKTKGNASHRDIFSQTRNRIHTKEPPQRFWENDSSYLLNKPFIVVVSDDPVSRYHLCHLFESEQIPSAECTISECLASAPSDARDSKVFVIDISHCAIEDDELVERLKSRFTNFPPVLIIDNPPRRPERLAKFLTCSFGYYTKPCCPEEIKRPIGIIFRLKQLIHANEVLKHTPHYPVFNSQLVMGKSPKTRQLIARVEEVAATNAHVFLTGELGTRKDIIAQHIHVTSRFRYGPYNTFSFFEPYGKSLELFFFGAAPGVIEELPQGRIGMLEVMHGGTFFLNHIEYTLPSFQERLLTCLKHRVIFRQGSRRPISANIRFVIASYTDLEKEVRQGSFSRELYEILLKTQIRVPALRECKQDIPLFFRYAIEWFAKTDEFSIPLLDQSAIDKLCSHSWPYNIRELEIVIKNAIFNDTDGVITADDIFISELFAQNLANWYAKRQSDLTPSLPVTDHLGLAGMKMDAIQKQAIIETLRYCAGNKAKTAKTLGISEKTLHNRLKEYGLSHVANPQ